MLISSQQPAFINYPNRTYTNRAVNFYCSYKQSSSASTVECSQAIIKSILSWFFIASRLSSILKTITYSIPCNYLRLQIQDRKFLFFHFSSELYVLLAQVRWGFLDRNLKSLLYLVLISCRL